MSSMDHKEYRIHLGSLPMSYFITNLIRKPPLLAVIRATKGTVPQSKFVIALFSAEVIIVPFQRSLNSANTMDLCNNIIYIHNFNSSIKFKKTSNKNPILDCLSACLPVCLLVCLPACPVTVEMQGAKQCSMLSHIQLQTDELLASFGI